MGLGLYSARESIDAIEVGSVNGLTIPKNIRDWFLVNDGVQRFYLPTLPCEGASRENERCAHVTRAIEINRV